MSVGSHAFAASIGLRREWFQDHPSAPHYDLTPAKRALAVANGARETTRRALAIERNRRARAIELARDGHHAEGVIQPSAEDLARYGRP